MRIVKAEKRHLPDILALEKESFSVPWSENSFTFELNSPDACFLVAEEDSMLAGFLVLHRMCDDGELFNIAVAPGRRRSGIGSELMKESFRIGGSMGIKQIYLEVRASNEAAGLMYAKLGFERCGVRKNYYNNPTEDAILMMRYLPEGNTKEKI